MTNGMPVVLRAAMKPIPTMRRGLPSYDVASRSPSGGHAERGDVSAVPSACVVGEAMAAWTMACAVIEQFGGDRMDDLAQRFMLYRRRAEGWNLHA